MEIWSEFIHEEIFLLTDENRTKVAETPKEDSKKALFELGVVATIHRPEDEELLNGILNAIKLPSASVIRKNKIDDDAKTWLIFENEIQIGTELHFGIKKFNHADRQIIMAYPLSRLRGSQVDKAELWGLLKAHFGL